MLAVTGGRVLRPDMTVERADVLVDPADGTIAEVGDVTGAERTLDASGGLVVPGLVNAHTHVAMTLLRGYADDKPLDAWLREDIWPVEAELEPEDVRAGAALGVLEMIKSGTTAFADMYFEVEETAAVVRDAGLRATLGYGVITVGKDEAAVEAEIEETFRVAEELDGAADGRIATAVMPHSLTTVNEETLRTIGDRADEEGIPVHIHVNETADEVDPIVEERGVRPLEYAADCGLLGPDSFVAHGVHLDSTEIDVLADTGTAVVHCPASNMKLASGMAPVERLREAGVGVGVGTDGAASNNDLDLFDEMRDAAMVGKLAAEDASAVPAESVVEMATQGGARALGVGSGHVAAGEPADLAVVDLERPHLTPLHDAVSHLAYAVRGSDVRHTVCDGQVLMADREVLTMDERAVRETAASRARDLVSRAER